MSKGKKNTDEQQKNYWVANAQASAQAAAAPDPLEEAYKKQISERLAWESGPRDITDPRAGLSDFIQIGQAAQAKAHEERHGTGALQLADGGASGYAQKLRELGNSERAEDFGTSLEQANALKHAEATGSVMPLVGLAQNRKDSQMGFAGNMAGTYLNRPKEVPFWKQLTLGALGSVGGMFTGRYGK